MWIRRLIEGSRIEQHLWDVPMFRCARERLCFSPLEIDEALEGASADPVAMEDARLWQEWLAFLDGAAQHGGVRIKP